MQERQIIATATEQSKQLKFMITLMLCRIELHSLVLERSLLFQFSSAQLFQPNATGKTESLFGKSFSFFPHTILQSIEKKWYFYDKMFKLLPHRIIEI